MMEVGKKAPDFVLAADDGSKVRLSELKGKTVVLYFYPKDDTPGCTRQAEGFRDVADALRKRDVEVLGVSKDSLESHGKFRDKYSLNFRLLSDPDGPTMQAYGAWGEKNMYGKKSMGVIRTTVVIDRDGIVRKIFPKVRVDGHVQKVVEFVEGQL